jgi:hypothetical protein
MNAHARLARYLRADCTQDAADNGVRRGRSGQCNEGSFMVIPEGRVSTARPSFEASFMWGGWRMARRINSPLQAEDKWMDCLAGRNLLASGSAPRDAKVGRGSESVRGVSVGRDRLATKESPCVGDRRSAFSGGLPRRVALRQDGWE